MYYKKQDRKKLYFQILGVVSIFCIFSLIIFLKDTSNLPILNNNSNTDKNLRLFDPPIYDQLLFSSTIQNWNQNRFKIKNALNLSSLRQNFEKKEKKEKNRKKMKYIGTITQYQKQLAQNLFLMKGRKESIQLYKQQRQYFEQKYHISKYKQLPFCIVVSSYNNAQDQRYLNNIKSILQQDYKNYHIVFFDDCSDDNTGELIRKFALDYQIPQEKLQIIINIERKMPLFNFYQAAINYCQPFEIFVIVDGDDELIGTQTFKLFNSIYQSKDLWVVYSNFLTSRQLQIGYSLPYTPDIIQRNLFRKAHFVISHLRSFYTKLFTLIQERDLKDQEGNWFRAANDVAMFIPILEMAHKKIAYIPELTYIYNVSTGLNNHQTKYNQQSQNVKKIKAKNSYLQLKQLFTEEQLRKLKENVGKQR